MAPSVRTGEVAAAFGASPCSGRSCHAFFKAESQLSCFCKAARFHILRFRGGNWLGPLWWPSRVSMQRLEVRLQLIGLIRKNGQASASAAWRGRCDPFGSAWMKSVSRSRFGLSGHDRALRSLSSKARMTRRTSCDDARTSAIIARQYTPRCAQASAAFFPPAFAESRSQKALRTAH